MFGSRFVRRRWRIGVLSLVFSALVLLGVGGYVALHAAVNASLYSFVPLESPGAASIDLPWLWKSTAELRKTPEIEKGLQSAEAMLGVSVENDLMSWVGQTGFVLTDVGANDMPAGAILFQVRDAGHAGNVAKLQDLLKTATQSKWLSLNYKGIAIQRTEISEGKDTVKLAMMTVDGWVILAVGDGVVKKMIDAHNGTIPSLEKHPLYAKAMGALPAETIGQFCMNGQALGSLIAKHDADAAKMMKATELDKMLAAGTMSGSGKDLQFDGIQCTTGVKTQAMQKQLRADAGTITGNSLTQLPEGAFATILVSNPDAWVNMVETKALDMAPDANTRQEMQQGFEQISDLRTMLKRMTGELGVAVAWKKGTGFGVTLAGEAKAADDAGANATGIKAFLEKQDMKVDNADSVYSLPETKGDEKMFPTLISWTARDKWLLAGTHPGWLAKPAAQPALALPEFARGATMAAFGNFTFFPEAMKEIAGNDPDALKQIDTFKDLLGQWSYAVKIDEDGGAVRSHMTGNVIPMLAMSSAVLFPVFAKARDKAKTTTSISYLRQLALVLIMNAQDHGDQLPALKTTADLKKAAAELMQGDNSVLVSPRTGEPYTPNPIVSGKKLNAFAYPALMIVVYEKTPGKDGSRCAAFLDGHVELIPAEKWAAAKKISKIP